MVAGVGAAVAVVEDGFARTGIGYVAIKGTKGATALVRLARGLEWGVAERLAIPHAGTAVTSKAIMKFTGNHAWSLGWGGPPARRQGVALE